MSKKKSKKNAEQIASATERLASAERFLTLFEPGSYGKVVDVAPHIAARRVPAGITFTTYRLDPNGSRLMIEATETRTDLEAMRDDLGIQIMDLGGEIADLKNED